MTDYSQRSTTARTKMPTEDETYGYTPRGTTGRTSIPRETDGYTGAARPHARACRRM